MAQPHLFSNLHIVNSNVYFSILNNSGTERGSTRNINNDDEDIGAGLQKSKLRNSSFHTSSMVPKIEHNIRGSTNRKHHFTPERQSVQSERAKFTGQKRLKMKIEKKNSIIEEMSKNRLVGRLDKNLAQERIDSDEMILGTVRNKESSVSKRAYKYKEKKYRNQDEGSDNSSTNLNNSEFRSIGSVLSREDIEEAKNLTFENSGLNRKKRRAMANSSLVQKQSFNTSMRSNLYLILIIISWLDKSKNQKKQKFDNLKKTKKENH